MVRIGICDDEPEQIEAIKSICERFFRSNSIVYECIVFSSGDEVLKYKGELMHLLFLDIEMGKTDGIQVMKQLSTGDNVWRIVFVSSHEEVVFSAFGIKTLGFEKKPVSYDNIVRYIKVALQENKENVTISFNRDDAEAYVKLESLLFIKGDSNYVRVYTKKHDFIASGNIKKWEEELKHLPMLRVHKSYLVNMQNIKKISTEVLMQSGSFKVPIGRKYKKDINTIFDNYLMQKLQERIG